MRLPTHHIADSVVARILTASKRVRARETPPVPTEEPTATELPPMAAPEELEPVAQPLPPLDESGLDMGAVLAGDNAIDALLRG